MGYYGRGGGGGGGGGRVGSRSGVGVSRFSFYGWASGAFAGCFPASAVLQVYTCSPLVAVKLLARGVGCLDLCVGGN